MSDVRVPLESGKIYEIGDGQFYKIIGEPIGYGASCLVYEAEKQAESKHMVIIKEFYPKELADSGGVVRNGNEIEVQSGQDVFDKKKVRFVDGLKYQTDFTSENSSNSMQGYPEKVYANGTVYSFIGAAVGRTLD